MNLALQTAACQPFRTEISAAKPAAMTEQAAAFARLTGVRGAENPLAAKVGARDVPPASSIPLVSSRKGRSPAMRTARWDELVFLFYRVELKKIQW